MAEPEFGEPIANGEDTLPAVGVLSQYVKDFSFENPNAPGIYQNQTTPSVDIQFNIGSGQVGEEVYEVALKIDARCTMGEQVAYVVDLTYAGLFGLRNVPAEQLEPFLMSEAPRLLFPFARRVLADAVRDGGYPPLMLDPIDFHGLYLARLEQQGDVGQVAGQA